MGYVFWRIVIDGGSIAAFCKTGSFAAAHVTSRPVLLTGAFTLGYIITLAFSRIITIVLPETASIITILSLPIAGTVFILAW